VNSLGAPEAVPGGGTCFALYTGVPATRRERDDKI